MRKCIRCGADMKEGLDLKVEAKINGVVLGAKYGKAFDKRPGRPKVAVCPECGEISLYIDDPEVLERIKEL